MLLKVGQKAAIHGLECNVSSPGAVTRLANAAVSQMGSIDVWINNAGYSGRYQVVPSQPLSLFFGNCPYFTEHYRGNAILRILNNSSLAKMAV